MTENPVKKVVKKKTPNFEEGDGETNLAVVGEEQSGEESQQNVEIREKILQLLEETENKTWDLAVVLETAYAQDMYRQWGFESFKEYVEKELNMQIRKAQYLVQLQEWFRKMPGNIQKWVRELGWTKARMLMHIVTVENAAEWRNKVAGKSAVEISEMLKEAKDAGGVTTSGGDEDGDAGEKPRKKTFSLFPAQDENVDRALDKASEVSGSDKPGHNLDMICTEYLATNAGVDSMQEYLRKQEKMLGVRLVAYVESSEEVVYGTDLVYELEEIDKTRGDEEGVEEEGGEEESAE